MLHKTKQTNKQTNKHNNSNATFIICMTECTHVPRHPGKFFTSPTLDPLVLVLFYVEMGARWQVGILCQCSGCREAPSTSCTLATLLALTISTFHHQLAICIPLQNHHILSDGIKTRAQNETCFKKRK